MAEDAGPRGRGRVWRAVLGLAIVVAAGATFGALFLQGQFGQLAHALSANKSVRLDNGTLAPAGFGGPQTLLLIGNDQRKHTTTAPVVPHSNEMLLVRIDPGKPWISMLSIPRELQVNFSPSCNGLTTTRLNAALMCGGINRVVQMIKQVTGLSINHVVEIDFGNFERAINDMGCVYGTIDRRYFHVNVPGGPQYFQVNLQPGYQDLCGSAALQFVTYRHDDTSLERDARDQDFLMEVKKQYGPTLIDNISKFETIFGQTVQTDASLHTTGGVESLVGTLISVAGLPVRQVKFQVNLGVKTNCACVTASPQQVQASVNSFLYGKGVPPAKKSTASLARNLHHSPSADVSKEGMIPLPGATIIGARTAAQGLPFPFELPPVQVDNGQGDPVAFRRYRIKAPGGQSYPIYVAVFSTGILGQYYDVQGTSWLTAPILDNPDQSVSVGGRTYYVYYSGQHIDTVAWFADGAAYWVKNTLTSGLSNTQMLSLAERTAPLAGTHTADRQVARHQAVLGAPVTVKASAGGTSPWHTVGVFGGLLAVVLVPIASLLLLLRHGDLRRLREASGAAEQRVMTLEAHLARLAPVRGGGMPAAALAGSAGGPAFGGAARAGASGGGVGGVAGAGRGRGDLDRSRMAVYGSRSRVRGAVVVATGTVVAIAVVAAALIVIQPGSGSARPAARVHRAAETAPVVVLNGGGNQGEAARLARALRRDGANVAGAANLGSPPPGGFQVLYRPGARHQATMVAAMLSSHHPVLAPVDPVAQAAAGVRARVVVVIP